MTDKNMASETPNGAAEKPHGQDKTVTIQINGNVYNVQKGKTPVDYIKRLGNVPADQVLSEKKGQKEVDLNDVDEIVINGGEVFTSHSRLVSVTINGISRDTLPGENTVVHLRDLGKVPPDEILSQFKNGQFVDLDNGASLNICGGEIFASHRRSGGSA